MLSIRLLPKPHIMHSALAFAIRSDYNKIMRVSELKRLLKEQGVTFEEGGRHTIARLGSRMTTIPRHPSQEVRTGTLQSILKRLGLTLPKK